MRFTGSLKKNYEFKLAYRQGKSAANRRLALYVRPNGTGANRLGVSVSKKVGKSVVRSRVKRLIKESYRLNEPKITRGYDLVFVARVSSGAIPQDGAFKEIEGALLHLLGKLQLIKDDGPCHSCC